MKANDVLSATIRSIQTIDDEQVNLLAYNLAILKSINGRLFILGNGGGHGHASHAVCDFRKLCRIEAYCPSDNASELTARVNDDGWDTAYSKWLQGCNINEKDAVLIVSVGGGSELPPISTNLVNAIKVAKQAKASVFAIVGRDGGYSAKNAHLTVLIPCDVPELVTPVTEGVQSVILHALAVHPALAEHKAKWESVK